MKQFDVIVIGAGGAGLFCAKEAGQRGRNVLVLDHNPKAGSKILISGGGRCNFTNQNAGPENYLSQNPHFCKSALSRFTSSDFLDLVKKHQIPFREKKLGQLFCDLSAQDIVDLLLKECEIGKVQVNLGVKVLSVEKAGLFKVWTSENLYVSHSLVVATGGLSIPKLGATDFGYELAKQFEIGVVPTRPALDGFRFSKEDEKRFGDLTGLSVDCTASCGGKDFRENVLFTHAGLSGPAALQASLYWEPGDPLTLNFFPDETEESLVQWWVEQKNASKSEAKTLLSQRIPSRLAERLCELYLPPRATAYQMSDKQMKEFTQTLTAFSLTPHSTVGYSKAEVTKGGVDTKELSSQTMESRKVKGLYFIGEVVDVTGWLGGYNFQWAWSSAWAAGQVV